MNRRTFVGSLLGFLGLSKSLVAEEKKIAPLVSPPKKELIQHGWVCYEEIGIVLTNPNMDTEECSQRGEREIEQRNGFGKPFIGGRVGDTVSCLRFTYEGFPDNRKCLMSAVLLKGIIFDDIEKGMYVVKMDYNKDVLLLERYSDKHVLPLTEEEYKAARSCEMASYGNYSKKPTRTYTGWTGYTG